MFGESNEVYKIYVKHKKQSLKINEEVKKVNSSNITIFDQLVIFEKGIVDLYTLTRAIVKDCDKLGGIKSEVVRLSGLPDLLVNLISATKELFKLLEETAENALKTSKEWHIKWLDLIGQKKAS